MNIMFIVLKIAGGEIPREVDTIFLHSAFDHFYGTLFYH
jgi:hypothetical protein